MKKFLWVILLALLAFFMFLEISQAGECIFLYSGYGGDSYYDSSDVKYSGDIVSYVQYVGSCTSPKFTFSYEIDCAKRLMRKFEDGNYTDWVTFYPGSGADIASKKLCR
jgi:hypothetical protein